MFQLVCVSI